MKVSVNGRFLSQKMTGVQRVAYNFSCELQQLSQNSGQKMSLYVPPNALQSGISSSLDFQILGAPKPYSLFWEQIILPFVAYKNKEFLLNFGNVGPLILKKQAVMIHDMAVFRNPSWFSPIFVAYYKFVLPILARRSTFIMTVSNFSKREIIKFLKIDPSKVLVLPLWLSGLFEQVMSQDPIPDKDPYMLSVATLDPRKNHASLFTAYSDFLEDKLSLFVVGETSKLFAEDRSFETHSNNIKISFVGRCSDHELIKLYRKASFFCNLSFYEGFNLTALEAMACGCPLLLSDIPVHREVCQDAALYAQAEDIADIRKKMLLITEDKNLRETLIRKGQKRAQNFCKKESLSKLWQHLNHLDSSM